MAKHDEPKTTYVERFVATRDLDAEIAKQAEIGVSVVARIKCDGGERITFAVPASVGFGAVK